MTRSPKELLIEASVKAVCLFALAHPISAGCGLILSGLTEKVPLDELIDLLGQEFAYAVGPRLSYQLSEIEPGSLAAGIVLALRNALGRVATANRKAVHENQWGDWFANWETACKRLHHHRWKDLSGLAIAVGGLNQQPREWSFLKESLVLLDWSERIGGASKVNRETIPEGLDHLLEADLGDEFIKQLKELLGGGKFGPAHVDLTFEVASLAAAKPRPARTTLACCRCGDFSPGGRPNYKQWPASSRGRKSWR